MKVLVWNGPRDMTVEERGQPEPGANEALVRVNAVGICGSEIEGYLGQSSLRVPPLIMGHEFSGEVVAVGAHEGEGTHAGMRVTVNPLLSCGTCAFCRVGKTHVCPNRRLIGAHLPGGFAEYVVVPARALVEVPAGLDLKMAALTEPFAVAIHAVSLGQIAPHDTAVVWGAGSIGLLTICAARVAGAEHIVAVDTNPQRMEAARQVGARTVLDARSPDIVEQVREAVGAVPNVVVFDAVGRSVTRQAAVAVAAPAGRVVFIGLHDSETALPINVMIRSELALLGSYGYLQQDIERAVELLAAGEVPDATWIDIRALAAGPASFAELVDAPGAATKIILVP